MKDAIKTLFRGLVVTLIIAMPTEATLSKETLMALLPILIGYIVTHYTMLLPFLKKELSEHWQFNWTDAMSVALFTVVSGIAGYFTDTLHSHVMVTWSAFGYALWRGIVYAGKCFVNNSDGQIKPDTIINTDNRIISDKP